MADLETLLSDKGAWPSIQGFLHGKQRIDLLKAIEGQGTRPSPGLQATTYYFAVYAYIEFS